MRTLVLWDIDHTLIDAGGLSGEIYGAVFSRAFGRPMERVAAMAGRTDRAIIAETLESHGIVPAEDLVAAFAEELAALFEARRHELALAGRTLPGVPEVLVRLAAMRDVVQSVLTGNMKAIAATKLAAFGLTEWVDLDAGAFGMDGADRSTLVALAQRRAEGKYGHAFDRLTTVLIGDTPHDVRAGHDGGARVVAVATGGSDVRELRGADPEHVLPDLSDTDHVVRAILGTGDGASQGTPGVR
ncbi:haloacid dehalogenase-like hydrolase [Actinomadura sp. DC4]|uniref:HAD family hydrolase n=1 Tax=Actinomadura sp. DC4 TaxID=3055069 RepID=UPI0025B14EF4|nr:haloacid dehalogenase-like hydrolase [Actinomadura sp. DC4]MDN3359649.1 haloacid dehalogenase-like hydrolase [Actinomadura sp. DC4]